MLDELITLQTSLPAPKQRKFFQLCAQCCDANSTFSIMSPTSNPTLVCYQFLPTNQCMKLEKKRRNLITYPDKESWWFCKQLNQSLHHFVACLQHYTQANFPKHVFYSSIASTWLPSFYFLIWMNEWTWQTRCIVKADLCCCQSKLLGSTPKLSFPAHCSEFRKTPSVLLFGHG